MPTDAGTFTVEAKDLAAHITMRVKLGGLNRWIWRVQIAKALIRLAAWVMWANVEIEIEADNQWL